MQPHDVQTGQPLPLPEISPLIIRKTSRTNLYTSYDPAQGGGPMHVDALSRSPSGIRKLPPRPDSRKGALPKIQIPVGRENRFGDEREDPRAFSGSGNFDSAGDTVRAQHQPMQSTGSQDSMKVLRDTIGNMSMSRQPSRSRLNGAVPLNNAMDVDDAESDVLRQLEETREWSDEVLTEISRIGEGASGTVHAVRDTRTGIVLARKTVTTREAPMKQLLRELNIATTARHPNIVKSYGAYISPSSSEVKVVMEFCEGRSLEAVGKRIRQGGARVGEKVIGRFADGILEGLAYLHSQKIIHRDIKPSNILISRRGIVKLCDFGVSGELVNSEAMTFTGSSLYMAPERIHGQKYNIRSDVWSTGLSLLEFAMNRFPIPVNDQAPIELMVSITRNEPPQLEDEPGLTWSDAMKDFIRLSLTVSPMDRPSPEELLSHPWITQVRQREVNMAAWISQVWGW